MSGHREAIKSTPTVIALIILSFVCISLLSSCGSYKNMKLTSAVKEALRENPNVDYTKLVCNVSEGIAPCVQE